MITITTLQRSSLTEADYQELVDLCTVKVIPGGHEAVFFGTTGSYASIDGPDLWTEKLARRSAIFLWALKMREGGLS